MQTNYSDQRKIASHSSIPLKPDGTPNDNDRVEIGPTQLAFDEWGEAGLSIPNLSKMREHRLVRLTEAINQRDLGGILLFDPLNIRYATDTTNMQLWNTHNPFRACFVSAGGYMVVWDFKANDLLTGFNPLIKETRGGASFFYFVSGDKIRDDAKRFAQEVEDLMVLHHPSNKRLAIDKIQIEGYKAVTALGIEVRDGEEVMEKTRSIKGPEDILAMKCAVHACEKSMQAMQAQAEPGMTENEIWAILHSENIKRGGEWIETRLLASGPRINPWFQECGPRIVQEGDLLAFDTDLIGCYGICVDMSRTWLIGERPPHSEQIRLYTEAHRQIIESIELLEPGKPISELVTACRPLPEEFVERRYSSRMHGVGLCDEWPLVQYPQDFQEEAYQYDLAPGMVLCVETYIGAVGGREGIKLEDQVLITESGYEVLTAYPYEQRLLG